MSYYDNDDGPPEDDEDDGDEEVRADYGDEITEISEKLIKARKIIAGLMYPSDIDAADGVTVAEVIRQEARDFLGVKRIYLETPRVTEQVRLGIRKFAILPAAGPATAPRYIHPPAASEGGLIELYDGAVLLGVARVMHVQALSMERSNAYGGEVAWSQCGRDRASFPLYEEEERSLTEMDGWPDKAARFAHYLKDGKRFDGHVIHWETL